LETLSGGPRTSGGGPRHARLVVAAAVALAIGVAGWWVTIRSPASARPEAATTPTAKRAPAARPSAESRRTGTVEIAAPTGATVSVDGRHLGAGDQRATLDGGPHRIRVEQPGHDPFERDVQVIPGRTLHLEARLEVEAPRLRVSADVGGAQVFVDRRFVGTTPVVVSALAAGPHHINVSAEGYESHSETVDVTPGANDVTVRFREVRLDESLAVTHKHGLGSCRGHLLATVSGLRYQTDHTKDAFSLPFTALEPLEVDYLEKNLRVKQRGGRTFNFTADSADALLVFQKAVEKARARLE
jgi:PEGA domain